MGSIFKFPQAARLRSSDEIAAATAFLFSEHCEQFEHSLAVEIVGTGSQQACKGQLDIEGDIVLAIAITGEDGNSLYIPITPANALAFASALQAASRCVASNRKGAGLE